MMEQNNTVETDTLDSTNISLSSAPHKTGLDIPSIFRILVICIGVIGFLANGFILRALFTKNLRKSNTKVLITNQSIVDLICCALLILTNAIKLPKPSYNGIGGSIMCVLIGSEMLVWMSLNASFACLAFITMERYLKIVHPMSHRKYFQKWMLYVTLLVSWVDGIAAELSGAITSRAVNGDCVPYSFFASPALRLANGYVGLIWQFIIPLIIIIYCYGHILYAIRSKSKVFHGDYTEQSSGDQARAAIAARTKMNIIKTLITIATAFFLCWCPNQIYSVLSFVTGNVAFSEEAYYGTVFVGFLNVCLNPFIYATTLPAVKNHLMALIGFKMTRTKSEDTSRSDGMSNFNTQRETIHVITVIGHD